MAAQPKKRASFKPRVGDHILLPAVTGVRKYPKDTVIQCQFSNPTEHRISAVADTKLSKNQNVIELTLDSGETIVITHRKRLRGKLRHRRILSIGEKLSWVRHEAIDDFGLEPSLRKAAESREQISDTWKNRFAFRREVVVDGKVSAGLRPPQIGALHAIGAHWSLSSQPATIVMPTGTGKTETMIGSLVAYLEGPVLVVVPSNALRKQIADKFLTLGLLEKLDCIPIGTKTPIVGILKSRPGSEDDLKLFDECHVIIATMSSLCGDKVESLYPKIVEKCGALIVDEAHHVPAKTWATLREAFAGKKVLQFTATPYRRDGKTVDGKCIYSYSLGQAQKDGYFKPINFQPVSDLDAASADQAIAEKAIECLKADLKSGHDHLLMARCRTITRAQSVKAIYDKLAPELKPIILHSEKSNRSGLDSLLARTSKIVVCVDMLGEGFDLPQLKIAALHDVHKSLAVLLQFTGRFTRVADKSIGNATVIANIATEQVGSSMDRLYREDSDWNQLLSGYAGDATEEYRELNEFLENCERIDGNEEEDDGISISSHSLVPRLSAVVYKADTFTPDAFHNAIGKNVALARVWRSKRDNVLIFVTKELPSLIWCRSRTLTDRDWHLYIAHYNKDQRLLFIHSSNKETLHNELAQAVTKQTAKIVSGDTVFRSLFGVKRLMFQSVGLKKPGRRNLRYSMYTGADVAAALSPAQKASAVKSNVFGIGYESGAPTTIGCSMKGRIWSYEAGQIPRLLKWCSKVGAKVSDDSVKTDDIIENVLIPTEIDTFPTSPVLAIEWPVELLERHEDEVHVSSANEQSTLVDLSLKFESLDSLSNRLRFSVVHSSFVSTFDLTLNAASGWKVSWVEGAKLSIRLGKKTGELADWFAEYPPKVIFVDGSELDGNLLLKPNSSEQLAIPEQNIETWDWNGVDLKKESIWKGNKQRIDSIQYKSFVEVKGDKFEIIFDDDGSGEAADLVCIREEPSHICLRLIHCKYSQSPEPGERVKDLVEVCSQAVRSRCWHWKFLDLCRHLLSRETSRKDRSGNSRFLVGDSRRLRELQYLSKQKQVRTEIHIVQPGVMRGAFTADQSAVLNAAYSYLMDTIEVPLQVVASDLKQEKVPSTPPISHLSVATEAN